MVFSSLLFVFLFLPLNLLVYMLVDQKYKNIVQLVFSLIFYSWGGPRYLLLLVGESFVSWLCARQIEASYEQEENGKAKLWLIVECVVLLGLLGIFKYTGFILTNVKLLTGFPENIPNIVLPIGISFYTFQLLSYVIDVYWGRVAAQPAFWKLLLYSSLFHQCIAGPIVRYETVADEIDNRVTTKTDVFMGVRRFSIGLAKKAILANSCAAIADTILPVGAGVNAIKGLPLMAYWLGMICYTFEIYLDFSAYSDMAIGMGRMVGFHYLENFNYPYIAKSVQDFWRRWHISLSTFFRDYVYIPLGGNRVSTAKYIRNMAVVWFLTGMWHGANWNYIMWGLYYLAFLLLEKFVIKDRMPVALGHIYTLIVIVFGWTIFRFTNMAELGTALGGLVGVGISGFTNMTVNGQIQKNIFFLIFVVFAVMPTGKYVRRALQEFGKRNEVCFQIYRITEMIIPLVMVFLAMLSLIGDSYNPFLYFQF